MPITLTTGRLVSINGVQQENDTQGVNRDFEIDFLGKVAIFRFSIGSGAPSAFNIGVYDAPVTLTVDLNTGNWSSTNGLSGTIGIGTVNAFLAQFNSIRNAAEGFVAGVGVMPGVQVAW